MATFETALTRGTIIDAFAPPAVLQKVAEDLSRNEQLFKTHILVSRGLGERAAETTAPRPVRIRCLRETSRVEKYLEDVLSGAFTRAIRPMMPNARWIQRKTLSVFALDGGSSLRIDLGNHPADATDAILTFVCRNNGGAQATLRVWCGPLSGCSQPRAPVLVPLNDCRAAVTPALWPAEMIPIGNAKNDGGPLFAVIALLAVKTS